MKTFKLIDIIISIILILFFTCLNFADAHNLFIGYLVVGGWQVASMIIHQMTETFSSKGSVRIFYHKTVLVLFFLTMFMFILSGWMNAAATILMILLYFLLFTSPLLAIAYTIMCCKEYKIIKHRQLIQLRN